MKRLLRLSALPAMAFGAFIATSTSASAAIVCNGEGQCWHVPHPYRYARAYGLVVHPDTWRWGPTEHFVWREHPGRGYWRGGTWIVF